MLKQYVIKTTYGRGNYQALSIASDIFSMVPIETDSVQFDFTAYTENNPFSNLLIANTIRTFAKQHKNKCSLIPNNETYLSHLGFYQMIGVDYGKELGEAKPSDNYVPITKIKFSGDFYQTIEEKSKNLAALLKFDRKLSAFLEYLFVEAIRNVYEHAETNEVYLSAQKWPSKDLLEIAISDTGCGICNSLRKYRPYSKKSEEELIRLACNPGVSSRSNYSYLDKNDTWRNSGYGLYLMRKLAVAYGGCFLICSGNYALYEGEHGTEILKTKYDGTTIAIRIKTNTANDFEAVRKRIISDGQEESSHDTTAIHSASKSSGGNYNH